MIRPPLQEGLLLQINLRSGNVEKETLSVCLLLSLSHPQHSVLWLFLPECAEWQRKKSAKHRAQPVPKEGTQSICCEK